MTSLNGGRGLAREEGQKANPLPPRRGGNYEENIRMFRVFAFRTVGISIRFACQPACLVHRAGVGVLFLDEFPGRALCVCV